MDFEKDEFEQELENENKNENTEFFEFNIQKEEDIIDKSKIKRITKKTPVKYELKVDLKKKTVSFFVYLPKILIEEKLLEEEDPETGYIKKKNIKKEITKYESILAFEKKFFVEDNTVFIDNKPHIIPDFFNHKLIAQNDLNTWERVFYSFLSNKIWQELEKYKRK